MRDYNASVETYSPVTTFLRCSIVSSCSTHLAKIVNLRQVSAFYRSTMCLHGRRDTHMTGNASVFTTVSFAGEVTTKTRRAHLATRGRKKGGGFRMFSAHADSLESNASGSVTTARNTRTLGTFHPTLHAVACSDGS